ncbi:glycosyl hydrolase [Bifidobacterium callitrichos]|uniref:Glycosyl hydrolase n=1 Tax=Bifidobacterium callitrichos TaxID=762209 RepID=A0A5M9ZCQ9_9BIFI|nr:cellulase family glycosylhydrolase [Bifidobacterium callitrichos]KAA8815747.1 glycosyl hydrolase [Bifidobacterium callitrichos]
MRFGVNYTPSGEWFYAWLNPKWDAVERDMRQIADLGADHVRIFPLWTLLQPNRTWINPKALDDLHRMVEIGGDAGLDVYVDVVQGHLSSFDFVPSWLVSWHETSMFADDKAIEAQCRLVEAIYERLSDVKAFAGLTLGNECNQFTDATHPRRMHATADETGAWLDRLIGSVGERAHRDGRVILHSENDAVWYADGHAFRPSYASCKGDMTTVHSWVFNGTAQHYGPMSFASTHHAAYLTELSKAFATDAHRPVWVQEIGAPGNVVASEDAPAFARESITAIEECPDVFGITWWCSHRIPKTFQDFPFFEHELGLFDVDGSLTDVGVAFRDAIADSRGRMAASPRTNAIAVPVDGAGDPLVRAAFAPGGSVFDAWMSLEEQGERPCIITSATADDAEALAARGITHVTRVEAVAGDAYSAVSDPAFAGKGGN